MPVRKSAPLLLVLVAGLLPDALAQQPIGRTSATEVQVSGAVELSHGETLLGNGSEITAGDQAVKIALTRGGALRLCSTSSVHLAKDRSVDDPASSALMMALDRGAIEANYGVGKFSDVLMTPDLRILISGPGHADLSIRVNSKGDTCVDNHGAEAPYVLVSSQLEGGAYRVMPGQRVSFQHGSLGEVVDHEPEPCGCPPLPAVSVAQVAPPGQPAPGRAVGGPSSTAADTAFPIAESEGLAPPPVPHNVPAAPNGQTQAQVSAGLTYNGEAPAAAPPAETAPVGTAPASAPIAAPSPAPPPPAAATAIPPTPVSAPPVAAVPPTEAPLAATTTTVPADSSTQSPAPRPTHAGGNVFHRLGHFFSRIFGK